LGIETSCDETSAAVLVGERRRPELAGLVILSQDVHKVFGGVVPELASRAHLAALPAVVDRALAEAGLAWSAVDAVAVTQGPGLVGALLVGVVYAKALAYAGERDLIGVHHMEGHLFAPALEDPELAPPFVALLVSGGHTLLLDVPAWGRYRLFGGTRDRAAREPGRSPSLLVSAPDAGRGLRVLVLGSEDCGAARRAGERRSGPRPAPSRPCLPGRGARGARHQTGARGASHRLSHGGAGRRGGVQPHARGARGAAAVRARAGRGREPPPEHRQRGYDCPRGL